MAHSFTNLLFHFVFATKERRPCLDEGLQPDLFAFIGGIVRGEGGIAVEINGMPEHVHVLMKTRSDGRLCDVLRAVKAKSSHWVRKTAVGESFAWQTGYGAFSVSHSQVPLVRRYIQNQREHHRNMTYTDEMRRLVRANGLEVDEQLLWE